MEHLDILLTFILILVAARMAGLLSRRAGLPAVLGELLAGLILGPSFLNLVHTGPIIETVADIGVLLLMFIAGLETDLVQMKSVGKASILTALGGVILPFAAGAGLALAAGMSVLASLFVGAALTATSVSVSVQVLQEVRQLRSRSGMVIMGAAIADDVLGILVLSLVLSFTGQNKNVWLTVAQVTAFFPVAVLVGHFGLRPLMAWIGRHHAREAGMALVLAIILLYSWSAQTLGGLAAITGAYVAGIMVSRLPEAEWIGDGAATLGQGLFVPVFFVTVGLHASLGDALLAPVFILLLTLIAVATKAFGAGIGARAGGCSWIESRIIGAGMVARGEVALVVATLGLNRSIITHNIFTVLVLMTLATTVLTPLLLKFVIPPWAVSQPLPAAEPAYVPVAVESDRA